MPHATKHSGKQSAAAAAPPPPDLEEMRKEMTRKLVTLVNRKRWPACPRRACRRQRVCLPVDFACANPRPAPEMTPQQQTASMAHFRRALARRLAALQGEA
jgi:hypothetical protein